MITFKKLENRFNFMLSNQKYRNFNGNAIRYAIEEDDQYYDIELTTLEENGLQVNFYAEGEEKNEQFSSLEEAYEWLGELVVFIEEMVGTAEEYHG